MKSDDEDDGKQKEMGGVRQGTTVFSGGCHGGEDEGSRFSGETTVVDSFEGEDDSPKAVEDGESKRVYGEDNSLTKGRDKILNVNTPTKLSTGLRGNGSGPGVGLNEDITNGLAIETMDLIEENIQSGPIDGNGNRGPKRVTRKFFMNKNKYIQEADQEGNSVGKEKADLAVRDSSACRREVVEIEVYKEYHEVESVSNGIFHFGKSKECKGDSFRSNANMDQVKEIGEMIDVSWIHANEEEKDKDRCHDFIYLDGRIGFRLSSRGSMEKEVRSFRPDCVFRDKLKNVKASLRIWSKESERASWMEARKQCEDSEREYGNMLRQKASIKWDVKGRFILDGVLIANETMKFLKKNVLIFKVDFEKAFDIINWRFLLDIMHKMGFGEKWCKWLNAIVSTTVEKGAFRGVVVDANNVTVSNLQYTDDTIFFGEWNKENAKSLMCLLKCFEKVSGLKVNYNKSKLYGIGVNEREMLEMARWMGCGIGEFLFTYLGLPIRENMRRVNAWGPVLSGGGDLGEGGSLWVRVIKSIHRNSRGLGEGRVSGGGFGGGGVWNDIVKIGVEIDEVRLKFSSSCIGIAERRVVYGIRGHGLITFGVGNEIGDKWRWGHDEDDEFTVKELTRLIAEKILHVESGGHEML
ncbi:hypothetical protein Tco_0133423 [Tanacetum coccineum]